ncbi:MAG TPA: exodeoxyribonuclease VII small subunit [Dehalococcoidia bacterium]|nr:exodeoxyribonuclease VII small subunit [Dehalococcoidia bacterium]
MASKKDAGPEDFETLYKRLEETVARLEEGGLTLDQSLALYEEGMKLARRCQELLQAAEIRITKLQEEFAALREEAEPYAVEKEEETPFE